MRFFKYANSDDSEEPVTVQLSGSSEPSVTVALYSYQEAIEGEGADSPA